MLIKGANLTQKQIEQVKGAFIYRWTIENEAQVKCIFNKMTSCLPTIRIQTDDQWINDHAFHFIKDGTRLMHNRHAEPHYLADEV